MEPVTRGLVDTSVLIDLVDLPTECLPEESAISVATLAEPHTGVLLASTLDARLARTRFVQQVEALYRAISIDPDTARTYAHLADASRRSGRSPRRRVMDLWIAETAVSHRLPLYTRNARNFAGLTTLLTVHVV